jgi:hypothetical protein
MRFHFGLFTKLAIALAAIVVILEVAGYGTSQLGGAIGFALFALVAGVVIDAITAGYRGGGTP